MPAGVTHKRPLKRVAQAIKEQLLQPPPGSS
jgi:hypothetical protein